MNRLFSVAVAICLALPALLAAEEPPVFSGPQPGEKLLPLKVQGVYGDDAGQTVDYLELADGRPTVLIFLHQRTRPAAAVIRAILRFSGQKTPKELFSGLIVLTRDPTDTERWLKIPGVKKALAVAHESVHVGISPDGREGPGAYGLNRRVTLTILVASEGRVTASFALVQPSLQADVLKVIRPIVELTGGDIPKLEDLVERRYSRDRNKRTRKKNGTASGKDQQRRRQVDPELAVLLRAVIEKNRAAGEVDEAAGRVEKYVDRHPDLRPQVVRISGVIVKREQGTVRAREIAQKWIRKYGASPESNKTEVSGKSRNE